MANAPADLILALRDALADALSAERDRIVDYLVDGLRRRLTKADDPDADDVDAVLNAYQPDALAADLQAPAVLTPLARAFWDGGGTVEAQMGIVWGLKHRRGLEYAQQRAAEMVGMRRDQDGRLTPNPTAKWQITQTTRDELKGLVVNLMETEGVSWRDLKASIEKMPEFEGLFGEARSETVARTEIALSVNSGEIGGYKAAGVTHVRVLDNAECPICGPVAGTTQTTEWAAVNPIGHPNCVRSFLTLEGSAP